MRVALHSIHCSRPNYYIIIILWYSIEYTYNIDYIIRIYIYILYIMSCKCEVSCFTYFCQVLKFKLHYRSVLILVCWGNCSPHNAIMLSLQGSFDFLTWQDDRFIFQKPRGGNSIKVYPQVQIAKIYIHFKTVAPHPKDVIITNS